MIRVLAIVLLLTSICYGQIVGPEKVDLGQKIEVGIDPGVDVNLIFWTIPKGVDYVALDGNKKLYCWANVGSYEFVLNAAKINWEEHTVTQLPQATYTLVVGTPTPPTPPGPDLDGLALEVYQWGMMVQSNRELASALSDNYKSVSQKLKGIELTIEQALDQLREQNNKILNTQAKKDAWAVFGSRLQSKMESSWPMSREVFAGFLLDVSYGLSYVK